MKGYLVVVARDALDDRAGEPLLTALRGAVSGSRSGVLVLVDSLASLPGPSASSGASDAGAAPALLVVGTPPPYDGRPLKSLLLAAPTDPEDVHLLTEWLRDEDTELVDLPLELSGSLLHVTTAAPRTIAMDPAWTGRRRPSQREAG